MSTDGEAHDGRAVILGRIRRALGPGRAAPPVSRDPVPDAPVPRDYAPASPESGTPELLALFAERMEGTHATVRRTRSDAVAAAVAAVAEDRGLRRVIAPPGLDPGWLPRNAIEWIGDDPPLTTAQVEGADAVLTAATVAAADSGTLVLDGGPGQGRRVLSLLPDAMIVVLRAGQVVADLPAAVARMDPTRALTVVSGPSATVDIELRRVDGVHGPRELDVLLVDDAKSDLSARR
ncbi:LutC/YkgG family protein [Tomitella fengzijianii]|uniref:Lactate utilization protein C n=1 Tax=Tomitella fengzijianii TaxID=2597660 RepID=A0A516X6G9_9ACTN|nr:LUD domain-containing protein [Tomitella fengzijianii]QDQ98677.1 lactate utilization protein C [Tomitella fengzijianii]